MFNNFLIAIPHLFLRFSRLARFQRIFSLTQGGIWHRSLEDPPPITLKRPQSISTSPFAVLGGANDTFFCMEEIRLTSSKGLWVVKIYIYVHMYTCVYVYIYLFKTISCGIKLKFRACSSWEKPLHALGGFPFQTIRVTSLLNKNSSTNWCETAS